MTTREGNWVTDTIKTGWIEERSTRLHKVRDFMHRVTGGLIEKSKPRKYLHTSDGEIRHVAGIIRSAEGVRFYGSSLPLPGHKPGSSEVSRGDRQDPLAVRLGPDTETAIPAEGMTDESRHRLVTQAPQQIENE